MCKELSQGPGCCEASLRAELDVLYAKQDGLRDAFKQHQTPRLQKELWETAEDIAGIRSMLGQYTLPTQVRDDAQEPPRLSGGTGGTGLPEIPSRPLSGQMAGP